jgi:hypothetical protein
MRAVTHVEVRFNQVRTGQELRGQQVRLAGCYLEVFDGEWVPELVYGPNDRRWHRFQGDYVCEGLDLVPAGFDQGWLSVQLRDDEDNLLCERRLEGPLSLSPWDESVAVELRHTVWSDEGVHQEPVCWLNHQTDSWHALEDTWPEATGLHGRLVFGAAVLPPGSLFIPPVRGRLSPLADLADRLTCATFRS